MSICPHCNAAAVVERSASFRFRCGVCGGPTVPTDGPRTRRDAELASLVAAQRARAMAMGWTAAAVVLAAVATMTMGLAFLLFWAEAHVPGALLAAISGVAVVLAVTSARKARARNAEVRQTLDDAWMRAAEDLIDTRGGDFTAPELAAAMRTDDAHAETLLSRLSAHGRTRVRVRDDAELVYEGIASGRDRRDRRDPSGASRGHRS